MKATIDLIKKGGYTLSEVDRGDRLVGDLAYALVLFIHPILCIPITYVCGTLEALSSLRGSQG